uniref:Cytochrome P450 n=1 Tax=Salvator merianae TaxID=96440 RepID=A0A8D0DY67_SALMN
MFSILERTVTAHLLHLLIGATFVLGLLKVAQLYWKRLELLKTFKNFPGPPSCSLYSQSRQIKREEEFSKVLEWSKQYPYAYSRWFTSFNASLIIHHPDYVKAVFGRRDPKNPSAYGFLIPWIGKGLLLLNGRKWFQHRRLLTPGFHYEILKPYVALIADSTKIMLDKWEKLIEKDATKPVEVFEHVTLLTLESLMKCAFSYRKSTQMGYHCPYESLKLQYLNSSSSATDKIIEERKKSLQKKGNLEKIQQKRYLDFLDILLCATDENGVQLSDEDIRAEVDTFMFEGHDTTASGISWILYAMAQNQECQQKCREEIKNTLGDRDTVQWDDLGKIPYTTMCIKESLRLYPPVFIVSRQLNTPITFCDGRTLPAGTKVSINIYSVHRNPTFWPDPEVFDPMRFAPEKSSQRHSFAFIPFAAGARNCIGKQFAMNEMKVALAQTLLRFEIWPDAARVPVPVPQLVLKSANGIHLFLKKLN